MMTVVGQYNVIAHLVALVAALCLVCILYARFRFGFILLLLASTAMSVGYALLSWGWYGICHGRPSEAFGDTMDWWYAVGVTLDITAIIWCMAFLVGKRPCSCPNGSPTAGEGTECGSTRTMSIVRPVMLILVLVGGVMVSIFAVFTLLRDRKCCDDEQMNRAVFREISSALSRYKTEHGYLPVSLGELELTNVVSGASMSCVSEFEYTREVSSNAQGHLESFRLERRQDGSRGREAKAGSQRVRPEENK